VNFPFRLRALDATEFQHGLATRFGWGKSGATIFVGLQSDVFGDFFAKTFFLLAPGHGVEQTSEEAPERFHVKSSALALKKRAMMAAACPQS
jgi:hypothetical protein